MTGQESSKSVPELEKMIRAECLRLAQVDSACRLASYEPTDGLLWLLLKRRTFARSAEDQKAVSHFICCSLSSPVPVLISNFSRSIIAELLPSLVVSLDSIIIALAYSSSAIHHVPVFCHPIPRSAFSDGNSFRSHCIQEAPLHRSLLD